MSEEPTRISVSRDALRAELAEMELRLRVYFDERLNHKADLATVTEHALTLTRFSQGEFTPAQHERIRKIVEEELSEEQDRGWTRRERWFAAILVTVAVLSLIATVLFGLTATHSTAQEALRDLVK